MKKLWLIAALVAGGMVFAQQSASTEAAKKAAQATVDAAQPQTAAPVVVECEEAVIPVEVIEVNGKPEKPCKSGKPCAAACNGGKSADYVDPENFQPPWYDVIWQLMLMDIPVGTVTIKGWELSAGAIVVILLVVLMSVSASRKRAAAAAIAAKEAELKAEKAKADEEEKK